MKQLLMSVRAKRRNLAGEADCLDPKTASRTNSPLSVLLAIGLTIIVVTSCTQANLAAPPPPIRVNADTSRWVTIPAGEFLHGQFNEPAFIDYDYDMMVYDVTHAQYAAFLNEAFASGQIKLQSNTVTGFYPGDEFRSVKHEERIEAGDWMLIPLNEPSLRLTIDDGTFAVQPGWETHPMTMVSWFGARAYCEYYGWRLPTELEWEKAGRGPVSGPDPARPFPWGNEIQRGNANFYSSRDPFEDMRSLGSRTTPVGFYNGQAYGEYQTLDSASPYGLYDMAGNVWQWTADVYEGMHYRFLRGGSKDTYDMDLRLWVRNNATPTYVSPGVGFRCAR